MSKIRLHGTSSGYTEIAPVAASGNNTLTLPNDGTIISKDSNGAVGVTSITVGTGVTIGDGKITCDGSALTSINAAQLVGVCTSGLTKTGGFGKILQVVSVVASSVVSSTDVGPVDTGLSASITPSATSSKVLVIVSQSMMTRLTGGGGWAVINYDLVRDSTVVLDGIDNIALRASSHSPYTLTASMVNLTYLDSPNTTSSTTYKTQAGRGNSGGSSMNWKAQDNDSPSTITLLEVAG